MPPTSQMSNLSLSGSNGNNSPLQFNSNQQPPNSQPNNFNQYGINGQQQARPTMPPSMGQVPGQMGGPPSFTGNMPPVGSQMPPNMNNQTQFNQPPFMLIGQQQNRPGMQPGQMPGSQMQPGQMPGGQMPGSQMPGGQMQPGQMLGGQMQPGQMPFQQPGYQPPVQ